MQQSYEQGLMRGAIRAKIFQQSELMKDNLLDNTQFVYSKQHPTQVIDIKGTRYIRINEADIQEDTIDDLLSTMLGIEKFKEEEGQDSTKAQVIEDALKANRDIDGNDLLDESDLFDVDEFENITNMDELPIQPQMVKSKEEEQKEEDKKNEEELGEEGDDGAMTKEAQALDEVINGDSEDTQEAQVKKQEYKADQEIEQTIKDIEREKGKSPFSSDHSILSVGEIKALDKQAQRLLRAFKGHKGKTKKITPSKKISGKDMALDRDKVYYANKTGNGKFINMNFLIDMSGSMGGSPVKNAVSLVYIFNILAKAGHLNMNVIYSQSNRAHKITLPVSPAEVLSLHRVGSAEGLARSVHEHVECLKNTNLICLTDGNICDEPIDKKFWSKHRIMSTGVYVNSQTKDLREFSGTLNKWSTTSLVRPTLDELIETLIRIGLK